MTTCRSSRSSSLLVALLLLVAGGAHAEPTGKEQYALGLSLYQAERFPEAAEAFVRAYDLLHKPIILFNAAQANRKAGKFVEALRQYRQFLHDAEPADRASVGADAEQYKKEIEDHLAQERHLAEKADQEEAATMTPATPKPAAKPAPAAAPLAVTASAPEKKTPVYKAWWLWTVVGVAAAAIAVGVGVGVAQPGNQDPSTALGTRPLKF
jgi:tetratricopeptide (TPR) repeat protein